MIFLIILRQWQRTQRGSTGPSFYVLTKMARRLFSPFLIPPVGLIFRSAVQYLRSKSLRVFHTSRACPEAVDSQLFDDGTGLGLAVVHGIVTNHHGEITIESEVGRGTVFHVSLPAAVSALKNPIEAVEPTQWGFIPRGLPRYQNYFKSRYPVCSAAG